MESTPPGTDDKLQVVDLTSTTIGEDSIEALSDNVPEDRASRFYDRLRATLSSFLARKGSSLGVAGEFLFFVPDVFILLWRLTNDKLVSGKNKVLLGTGLAYYIFPLDIVPEALLGPIGFMDDLVFGVFILNKLLGDTDAAVIRKHWSGSGDVLEMIQRVLASADSLVASDFLTKIKKIVK